VGPQCKIEIRDAKNIWGKTVTDAQWAIRDELGMRTSRLNDRSGGENLVRYANVMTGIKNSGGRNRNGSGHGLKEFEGRCCPRNMDIKIAHPKEALEYNKRFIEQITSAKVNQTQGPWTPFIWGATNSGGVSGPEISV